MASSVFAQAQRFTEIFPPGPGPRKTAAHRSGGGRTTIAETGGLEKRILRHFPVEPHQQVTLEEERPTPDSGDDPGGRGRHLGVDVAVEAVVDVAQLLA